MHGDTRYPCVTCDREKKQYIVQAGKINEKKYEEEDRGRRSLTAFHCDILEYQQTK